MNIETSTTKGLTGTFGGAIQLPTILRVVLPGALAVLLAAPLLVERPGLGGLWSRVPNGTLEISVLVFVLSFVAGLPVSALSDGFYKVFEGRVLWPLPLLRLGKWLQNQRVSWLLRRVAKAGDAVERYDELWFELRAYPENDQGEPHATHPTLLGNILAAYEAYPGERYGMDAVFYWPRLWLELDSDKKQEIDHAWSVADGLVNLSAVSALGAGLWGLVGTAVVFSDWVSGSGIAGAIERAIKPSLPFGNQYATWGGVLALVLTAWAFYRISLALHRRNGEIFKAVFDLYRGKLEPLTRIGPGETEKWKKVWTYLQYGGVRCACENAYSAADPACPECSRTTDDNLEDLAALGKDDDGAARTSEDPQPRVVRLLTLGKRRRRSVPGHLVRRGRR